MSVGVMKDYKPFDFTVVYYESTKRDLNRRLKYECRCDERLKAKYEGSTLLGYTCLTGELDHKIRICLI
jgi:hypothetical protein